jgi:hypothetical protein
MLVARGKRMHGKLCTHRLNEVMKDSGRSTVLDHLMYRSRSLTLSSSCIGVCMHAALLLYSGLLMRRGQLTVPRLLLV